MRADSTKAVAADGRADGSMPRNGRDHSPAMRTAGTTVAWLTRVITPDAATALLRVWLGAMGIVHGYGKVFGGMDRFTSGVATMGFPAPELFAWSAGLTELAGGALLVLGLLTRPVALLMAITMGVAAFIRHADDPFKTKELAFTYFAMSVVVFLLGPGRYALDALMKRRRAAR
jgi:putative oxidoreductase